MNLRYFNAAGASEQFGEDHRIETHLIPNVLKVALGQKEKCEVYGDKYATPDGTCIRDFIHIHDLAAAHMLALGRETSASYNLGSGEGFSVRQVIDIARKVTGHPIPVVVKDAASGRSAPARRQLAQDHQRTRLAPEVRRASSPSSKAPGPGTRSTRTGTGIETEERRTENAGCFDF